jgi:hypothetical protein
VSLLRIISESTANGKKSTTLKPDPTSPTAALTHICYFRTRETLWTTPMLCPTRTMVYLVRTKGSYKTHQINDPREELVGTMACKEMVLH